MDGVFFHVKEAVRKALLNLEARAVPAGTMPVVLVRLASCC